MTPDRPAVVVADDSPTIRRLLSRALEQAGHRVVAAEDGVDALERIREVTPGLAIVDAEMPRLNGYELCRMIRESPEIEPKPHIIMLTAAGQDTDRQRARDVGVDEFMTKPFSPSDLTARADAILG